MHFPIQPIDQFGGPPLTKADVQIFTAGTTSRWQTWAKPRGVAMSQMIAIGGGGGGAGGLTNGNVAGGGGGSSSVTRLLIPAFCLPDELYIQVGTGGQGGAVNGGNGSAGGISYISLGHSVAAPNVIIASGTANAGGATGATGGTAGSVEVASAFSTWGLFASVAGVAGTNGGTSAVGVSLTTPWTGTLSPLTPGTGGGGQSTTNPRTGGNITIANGFDGSFGAILAAAGTFLPGGTSAGGNINNAGNPGFYSWQPFLCTGGTGGGNNINGSGGQGGKGAPGCGGGGGATSSNTGTSGRGGAGGDGLVVIISW